MTEGIRCSLEVQHLGEFGEATALTSGSGNQISSLDDENLMIKMQNDSRFALKL